MGKFHKHKSWTREGRHNFSFHTVPEQATLTGGDRSWKSGSFRLEMGWLGRGPWEPSGVYEMFFILIGGGFTSLFIHKNYLSWAHYCFMLDLNKEVKIQKQKTNVAETSLWGRDWGRGTGARDPLGFHSESAHMNSSFSPDGISPSYGFSRSFSLSLLTPP